ncbi:MAG TPA: hypothetical protein VFM01_04375 [Nakamurella sp.]|nr:hypothetical protein [Nakamurella sp.]
MSNCRVTDPGASTSRSQDSVSGSDSRGFTRTVRRSKSTAVTRPMIRRTPGKAWRSGTAMSRGSSTPVPTSGSSGLYSR